MPPLYLSFEVPFGQSILSYKIDLCRIVSRENILRHATDSRRRTRRGAGLCRTIFAAHRAAARRYRRARIVSDAIMAHGEDYPQGIFCLCQDDFDATLTTHKYVSSYSITMRGSKTLVQTLKPIQSRKY